ncbi:hypothetical protein WICMUC_000423 [Wickerhamomyces mucosus]|uniref:Post-GPI attachment to proteins factor 3 n=1 Tax=Wickerhamomyces mucosus TaxID=1378264 RepID=A0A9P8PXY9_9ASCO|nr:hypothetical protein WICMUC_000423 [Wickerhamomyces mucosus]
MFLSKRLLLTSILLGIVIGSEGDQLPEFERCLELCTNQVCSKDSLISSSSSSSLNFEKVPHLLKLLNWSCQDNCDYQCQQIITQLRTQNNEEIFQFHGKWPFKRLLGTQELASVIFSILNFIPHYINFQKLIKFYKNCKDSRKILYWNSLILSIVAMGAWIFSTIFHIRDLIWTERLDYFFAGATVLTSFYGLLIRVLRLDKFAKQRKWIGNFCIGLYTYHLIRLNYDWSYTYNMNANITIAILQYILFLILAFKNFKEGKPLKLWLIPIILILSVILGMSFEIFDFINLNWQIDAHAIWHLSTILPSFWLYDFFFNDIENLSEKFTSID